MDPVDAHTPAPQHHVTTGWHALEEHLARYLHRAGECATHTCLVLEMPGQYDDGGCGPYAELLTFDAGTQVRIELAGNARLASLFHLRPAVLGQLADLGWQVDDDGANPARVMPLEQAPAAARAVTRALREVYAITDPGLLTYRVTGAAAAAAAHLGMRRSDQVPVDVVDAPAAPARHPRNTDDLRAMVRAVVRTYLGAEPKVDDDGDIVILHNGHPLWVRVSEDQPAVLIFSCVAHRVRSRRAAALELGLLNRDFTWVTWVLRGRNVWQETVIPAAPFAPAHLQGLLGQFVTEMDKTRADLTYRVEGGSER